MMLSAFWPFYQFLWTIYFFTMMICGFWCILMFFGFIVPLWLTEGVAEYFGKINKNFDPEMATTGSGNIQGFEGGNLPASKTFGFNLKLQF